MAILGLLILFDSVLTLNALISNIEIAIITYFLWLLTSRYLIGG